MPDKPATNIHFVVATVLTLFACNAYDTTLLDKPMLSENHGACAGQTELCNGRDDDCDGIIDEEASDACALPHARSRCKAGGCELLGCDEGYLSCDGSADNGCEHDVAACGGCEHPCDTDRMSGAGQSAPPTRLLDGGKLVHDQENDAGAYDGADAGSCSAERCDGLDNDCDGQRDEGDVCCLAAAPTGLGAECDRCACERCGGALERCLHSGAADWDMACGGLLRCFGESTAAGRCSDDADCGSACAAAWLTAGWRPNRSCNADMLLGKATAGANAAAVGIPCDAFMLVRQTCYDTKCDKACKH